jgi:trimeric autotransporter adhesin
MNKKKAIKIAAATAMAASSFAAIAPFTTEAAVNLDAVVNNAVTVALQAHQAYTVPAKTGTLVDWHAVQKQLNLAKSTYNSAVATVNKLAGSKKAYYLGKLASASKYMSYAQGYITATDTAQQLHLKANHLGASATVDAAKAAYVGFPEAITAAKTKVTSITADTITKNLLVNLYFGYPTSLTTIVPAVIKANDSLKLAEDAVAKNDTTTAKTNLDAAATSLKSFTSGANVVKVVTAYQTSVQAKYDAATATPAVTSVSAINGKQLLVKFNKAVDQTSAETVGNYKILRNAATEGGFTAALQDDEKSVIITLGTPVPNNTSANFSVTIQNVLVKGSYYDTVKYYATSLNVSDTLAPEIASVTSTTNGATASSVKVTFSEPVASPTLKVDGVTKSASLSADGYTATITNLNLSATGAHTIDAINLTDLSGNVTASTSKSFNVTTDTAAANYSVSNSSDNAILLTYNKAMNSSTVLAGITLKGEDLNDLVAGTDYNVSTVGTDNKVFKITVLTNPFTSTKTSNKYTIVTKNTIADSLGNLSAASTSNATLSVDNTKPEAQTINYVKDPSGNVTKVLVKYSEAVTAQAGTLSIVNLTTGTQVASATVTGTVLADGSTVEYTLATPTALAGNYEVQLPTGFVKDTSFATNASVLTKRTVDFGAASSSTLKVSSASVVANAATVVFDSTVTYASATNPANYTINGVALPAGTLITLSTTTVTNDTVTFTLPANYIATTDTGAVLRVANVETSVGTKVSTNQKVVSVTDNTLPLFAGKVINANGTVSLSFNESVVSGNTANAINDFTFTANSKSVTVGGGNIALTAGTGADAGKYVFTFATDVATTAETGVGTKDATAKVYFDVNGNNAYDASTDILIQSYTGLQDADLPNYVTSTLDVSKFSSLVMGSQTTPTVVKDNTLNALKGDQAITIR